MISSSKKIPDTQVFHIRLGNNIQKLNIKDPSFLKILQQQYATKYLQRLGVQPNHKNINKILKQYPLQNCQIVQSRLNGGLHTDTITIMTKSLSSQQTKPKQASVSNQMLKILDLKKMENIKNPKTLNQNKTPILLNNKQKQDLKQKNQQGKLQFISFDINNIKQRYIFPFNQNFKRMNNYKMKDVSNVFDDDNQSDEKKALFQSQVFKFPFTQIKLNLKTLKQLQTPITTKLAEIQQFLNKFAKLFPVEIFPIIPQKQNKTQNSISKLATSNFSGFGVGAFSNIERQMNQSIKYSHIIFTKKNVHKMFQVIKSQQNAKLIGVFLHLAYWSIFGGVNPIQVDIAMKKKMYIMMFQTLQYFELKSQNKKVWQTLVIPMILLTLKMACHYFFTKLYPKLFQSEETKKLSADQIAFDKALLLIEKLLDQGNIKGRFVFLESDIDGQKGNFLKDKKYIRKRIFGTSPALSIILPDPKNGKTRSILAKSHQKQQRKNTINKIQKIDQKDEIEDKEARQKLLHLSLLKIQSRVQQLLGHDNNPIIKLKLQ